MDHKISIDLLNKAVADELLSVHQYMYFHFLCEDRGYGPLAGIFKRISITEMIHVEKLAERILFLKGEVIMKLSGPVQYIHEVPEMLKHSRELEQTASDNYNQWAKIASENSDRVTKKLFDSLLAVEEDHEDIFDVEFDNLEKLGDHYMALQAITHSKEAAKGESSD